MQILKGGKGRERWRRYCIFWFGCCWEFLLLLGVFAAAGNFCCCWEFLLLLGIFAVTANFAAAATAAANFNC